MAVTFSIKDVSDQLADAVRVRARANHRSLQGELMAMLEAHAGGRRFQVGQLLQRVRALGLETPSESVEMVREDRDRR